MINRKYMMDVRTIETQKKIRVLHFEIDGNPGGIETFLLNLYENIDRTKFEFDFITRSALPAKEKELRELGADIFKVSTYRNPIAYFADIKKILANGYDVIHIHKNSAANIIPFIVADKESKAIVIAHSHNTRPSMEGVSKYLHLINRKNLYKLSDIHLACSSLAGDWLYGDNEFQVIKNGIDVKKFSYKSDIRNRYRKMLGIMQNSFVLINVGHFTQQKNQMRMLDIFKAVCGIRPDSTLILIGKGELKTKLMNKADENGMRNKIIFLEDRNDINNLLMAADSFVMPSIYEGLPFSAIEAQAAGLPTFLADTISKETECFDAVKWFSLQDWDEKIADRIVNFRFDTNNRLLWNIQVKNSGFDISNTVLQISDIYEKLLYYTR